MKKFFYIPIAVVTITASIFVACNKDIEGRTDNVAALNPTDIDLDAGTWLPILLTGPAEFPVAAPIATNTPEYVAQINEIKTWQADLTANEKRIVKYWGAGAPLFWEERDKPCC